MGKVKYSENLFLGLAELNRAQKFLDDDGFKKQALINTATFGIIEGVSFPDLGVIERADCFYVSKAGSPFGDVVVNKGVAMNSDAQLIINSASQNLSIPNNSLWYWIRAEYAIQYNEVGTVSVDALGNLTGVGTNFLEVLRGQPNYPSKIKFVSSSNGNTSEYEVVSVTDATNCILSGDFTAESDLKYIVVGTFTPGSAPSIDNKNIFRYDSVKLSLVQEISFNQEPAKTKGKQFYLARVRNNGLVLSLNDKRTEWWRSKSYNYLREIDRITKNPLIGVEAVKYDVATSPKNENWIDLAFGFRFKSYTIDTAAKTISILIGNGGIYKDTSYFQSGKFNGWRLYTKNGDWVTVIDSQKSGSQIVVTLDVWNPNSDVGLTLAKATDSLFIAPPYEEIEILVRQNSDEGISSEKTDTPTIETPFPLLQRSFVFPINTPLARFKVPAHQGCYKYNLTYRYKVQNDYTDYFTFPNDAIGFYSETSFSEKGVLLAVEERTLKPYNGSATLGFIQVCEHPDSYDNFANIVTTGDLFGVNTTALDNATPVVNLDVGVSKRYQHYRGTLNLEANMFINLNRKDGSNKFHRAGNEFFLHIDQFITKNSFSIKIVEDYVNPTSFTLIKELTASDLAYIKNNTNNDSGQTGKTGLFITCTFNELQHWVCHYDTDVTPKGTVRLVKGALASAFNANGDGIKQGFWGWKIISDMDGKLPKGTATLGNTGTTGGVSSFSLVLSQIPPHKHELTVNGIGSVAVYEPGNNDSQRYSTSNNLQSYNITHTQNAGGLNGATQPITIDPPYMRFLYIEKII